MLKQTQRNRIRSHALFLLDAVEVYLPTISFLLMFIFFNLQIFFRYVLNNPLEWTWEGTIISYIWTILFAAGIATRNHVHVKFTMIYDLMPPRVQTLFRLAGDTLVVVAFILIALPSYSFIDFMKIKSSAVFKIPFRVIYMPFMVFVATTVGHKLYDIYLDLRSLLTRVPVKSVDAQDPTLSTRQATGFGGPAETGDAPGGEESS